MAFSVFAKRALSKLHYPCASYGLVSFSGRSSSSLVGQSQTTRFDGEKISTRNGYHSEASSLGGSGLPSYMRGAVFREPNKPLTIEEFHIPRPKAGEILIKTKGTVEFLLPSFFN